MTILTTFLHPVKSARNRYFDHIRAHKQWKQGIQGYTLASIYFADAMLGRVLDALEKGLHSENTIVVLWSDHGWHLEKRNTGKSSPPGGSARGFPSLVRVPKGVAGLPKGTQPSRCSKPVNLLSLAPTLLELSGLPPSELHDGPSLVPLLMDPKAEWPHRFLDPPSSPREFWLK